jgi:WD40 repeat protein/serine/threonine protein kinase
VACRARIGSQRSLADYGDEFPEIRQRLATDIALPTPVPQELLSPKAVTDHPSIAGYEILGELGEGGMGVVYKARQLRLGRVVALKMILAGAKARRRDLTRFQTEMEAVARLQHPNIVKLYEVGEHDGQPYCALEYVDGGNLAQKLAGTPKSASQAAQVIETLARAIHAAHEQNVIHRDLKPANILLSIDGTPKISDFGLAKQLTGGSEGEALLRRVTQTGEVVGTPSYMAPEQAQGKPQEVGAPADIYGLGAILYELLTGRPPFKGETMQDTLEQVRTQEPVAPSRLQPKLPRDLTTICLKCLQKDPVKRYGSAEALANDLRRFRDGKSIHARSVRQSEKLWRWCRRNPLVAILSTAAALLLVGLVTVLSVSTVLVWQANQELRQNLYYQHIALADREWSANNLGRAEQLLDECPAELRGWEWHYLKRLRLGNIRPLRHTAIVLCAAFHPDGRWVASGTQDGKVTVWDAATSQDVFAFPAHEDVVTSVAFSPDGRFLATTSLDHTVKVWEFDLQGGTYSLLHTLPEHEDKVQTVAFSPDSQCLASAGNDRNVRIWDAASGRQILVLPPGHTRLVWCVAYSPDGKYLATASGDKTVKIWDARTGREMRTLLGHSTHVWSVCFSPDGRWLASTAGISTKTDGEIIIWDAGTGQLVRTLRGHTEGACCAVFSPDGRRLASAGLDETVKIWDFQAGQEVLTLREHRGHVRSVAFSADGSRLASASRDRTVRIWDATPLAGETGQEMLTLTGHGGPVCSVVFSPDGQWLASAGHDGTVLVWNQKLRNAGGMLRPTRTFEACGRQVTFSPNGRFLASGGSWRDVGKPKVWATGTWKELFPLGEKDAPAVAFSPDSKYLATCHLSNFTIEIREASTGRGIHSLHGHVYAVRDLAFAPIQMYRSWLQLVAMAPSVSGTSGPARRS